MMSRCEFVGAAVTWPLAARAQRPPIPTIGSCGPSGRGGSYASDPKGTRGVVDAITLRS
jgi:hypothetical protein